MAREQMLWEKEFAPFAPVWNDDEVIDKFCLEIAEKARHAFTEMMIAHYMEDYCG